MAMLEVTSLGISFGGLRAVDELSMKIEKGGLVGLIGPNGAGKTTAFNMLTGVYRPTDGGIRLDGQNLIGKKPHEICRMGVARTFQNIRLFSELSVLDNVKTGLHNQITYSFAESMFHLGSYRKKEKQMDEKAMELLSVFGLENVADYRAANLPYGKQRKLEIARALATNPKILLCDEATSALDPTTTRSILALLKEINKTLGITIIVITHEMAVIEEICQRVAIIDSSHIAEVGTVDEVFTRPQSAMAKQLIYPDGKRNALATGKRYCRIVFDGNSSFEPIISNMVLECKAPVNILFADTKNMDGRAYGQMILQLPEDERAAKRALAYLETQNIHAEEVNEYAPA